MPHLMVDYSPNMEARTDMTGFCDALRRAAAEAWLKPAMARHSIALSLEMCDIDPDLAPKTGSIRDHLKKADQHD